MNISILLTLKVTEKHLKAKYFILNQFSINGKHPHGKFIYDDTLPDVNLSCDH